MELEHLLINGCPKLITFPDELGLLPELITLNVASCDNHATLSQGLDLGGFEKLTHLAIWECPKLTSLPISLLQRLPNLRELGIWGCPHFQRQFGEGGMYADIVSNIPLAFVPPMQDEDGDNDNNNRRLLGSRLMSNLCTICLGGGCII